MAEDKIKKQEELQEEQLDEATGGKDWSGGTPCERPININAPV